MNDMIPSSLKHSKHSELSTENKDIISKTSKFFRTHLVKSSHQNESAEKLSRCSKSENEKESLSCISSSSSSFSDSENDEIGLINKKIARIEESQEKQQQNINLILQKLEHIIRLEASSN